MAMDRDEHTRLEEWAKNYGGTAILGFICTLLIGGKFLHHVFQRRGLICGAFIVPPCLLSGIMGLIWFAIMDKVDPEMTGDMGSGLESLKANLINFVFAALILGLTCTRTTSHHNSFRAVMTSLLHEGMPMVIYSQILIWGQSTICLLVLCILNLMGAEIPKLFAAMVPLGIEAGSDVVVEPMNSGFWSQTVVEEAESLGQVVIVIAGIWMVSAKPYLIAKGWIGRGSLNILLQGSGQAEAFERTKGSRSHGALHRSVSVGDALAAAHSSPRDMSSTGISASTNTHPGIAGTPNSGNYDGDKGDGDKIGHASLGAHLSLIALTVFLSFGVSMCTRLIEIELSIEHRLMSGIRMFKLSMVCALISMMFLLRRSRIRFKRDWFMRLCGLMLDLLVIAALSKAYPRPKALEETHYLIVGGFVALCFLWNAFCFVFVAKQLFPNFWFERALVLTADTMGHSFTGLMFARTLDPAMESPVPAAYAYKLMLFFIPSSGGKNAIVVSILKRHDSWAAFVICACVVCTWMIIFETHFKHRFLAAKDKDKEREDPLISNNEGLGLGIGLGLGLNGLQGGDSPDVNQYEHEPLLNALSFDDKDGPAHSHVHGGGSGGSLLLRSGKTHKDDTEGPLSTPISYRARRQSASSPAGTVVSDDGDVGTHGGTHSTHATHVNHVRASEPSSIVSQEQMNTIASWLPDTRSARVWTLKYSLRRDGASADTLLSLSATVNNRGQVAQTSCIIVVQDSWGYVFGGFIAHALENKSFYYGNGESFVFSVAPTPQAYRWTGANSLFVISDGNCFAMGGGGDGFAFQLDDELDTGVSNRSATYNNGQLTSSEFFKCMNLEVWVLDNFGFSV